VAWIIHGLMVSYIGLFDSIPRLVALVLMAVWAFIMGYLMWRNGSSGRIRRAQSATPHAPHANSPTVSRARVAKNPFPSVSFYSPECVEGVFCDVGRGIRCSAQKRLFRYPSTSRYSGSLKRNS
jgi:hypothetical protein